ncbi:MAG: hypothetical protein E7290_14545 [Lachnospiraceae bacterium]|nr:hypothetical protein [Lachnospiraceae bacterium]
MDSLGIREFQNKIIDFTNQSQLPMEVKRLVFLNILTQIETETEDELHKQVVARMAQENDRKIKVEEEGEIGAEGVLQNHMDELSE